MYKFILAAVLLCTSITYAQLKGRITTTGGIPVPYVNVSIEDTYISTSSNTEGEYVLPVNKVGQYTVKFQSIGFKPKNIAVTITSLPFTLNAELQEEAYQLNEVVIAQGEDPAYEIMRQAIAHRKENALKAGKYEADFYSKGIFRAKNIPKRIAGVRVEMPDEAALDSTGSGVISLSETVSHIYVDYPDKLKENIIATKKSGSNSEFSFNSASEAQYNFYDDFMDFDFDIEMISPLSKIAMNYYRFKYEGSFTDEYGNNINKIKVIPRRDKEPVFDGYIYIADDSWAIQAADLTLKGYRLRQPVLETLTLKQNFSYNKDTQIWALTLQTFDISAGMLGMGVNGRYTHVYNKYIFHDSFEQDTFKTRLKFEEDSNKKDSVYWAVNRPVPLTIEEKEDYAKKDSIAAQKKAGAPSVILTNKNRFKVLNVLTGYTYRNTEKGIYYSYDGVIDLPGYNTVQGWNFSTAMALSFTNKEKTYTQRFAAYFNYGIAEDRFRVWGEAPLKIGKQTFYFSGGNKAEQFNASESISPVINTFSSLLFKNNFMKLYDKTFADVHYSKTIFKKLKLTARAEYLRRRPLYNNTDYVLIKNDDDYTSNNPLAPLDEQSAPFVKHTIYKASLGGGIRFGKSYYYQNPSAWVAATETNEPGLYFMYEKAFASNIEEYEYDYISARAVYTFALANKGDLGMSIKAGKFFNADDIAFTDYKHFNGNLTHINEGNHKLNAFSLLPYYTYSTNDSFIETHIEHNFKGYVMNKIPLLDLLQYNLVLGYNGLALPDRKPYHEFSAGFDNFGFGKFRFFKIDYIRAYEGGFVTDGIMLGIKQTF